MKATHLVHEIMGSPVIEDIRRLKTSNICAICGEREGDVDARDVIGGDFTGHHLLRRRGSPAICEACAWSKGHNPLRFSHWVASPSTGLVCFKWIEAAPMVMNPPPPPMALYLTTTWKKLGVLRAPVNAGAPPHHILFEELILAWDPTALSPVLEAVRALRQWFGEGEVVSGHYKSGHIAQCGVDQWQQLEAIAAPWRSSRHLEALAYCARKPKEEKEQKACPSQEKTPS